MYQNKYFTTSQILTGYKVKKNNAIHHIFRSTPDLLILHYKIILIQMKKNSTVTPLMSTSLLQSGGVSLCPEDTQQQPSVPGKQIRQLVQSKLSRLPSYKEQVSPI